jgi:hypothetical protein
MRSKMAKLLKDPFKFQYLFFFKSWMFFQALFSDLLYLIRGKLIVLHPVAHFFDCVIYISQ